MKKSLKSVAILMALVLWGPVERSLAADEQDSSAPTSAKELSELATQLAQEAARLEQLQASLDESKSARQSEPQGISRTTVRWMNTGEKGAGFEITDEVFVEGPAVTALNTSGPLDIQNPIATLSAVSNPDTTQVIRAQVSEELYNQPTTDEAYADSSADDPLAEDDILPTDDTPWGNPVVGGTGCCDTCCDTCCEGNCDACCGGDCCCQPCCRRPCTIVAGTEAVFLFPEFNGNRINYRYDDFIAPDVAQFGPYWDDAALDDMYVAPRLWLGVQGCKWGLVGRYFHLRAGEHDYAPFLLGAPNPHHSFAASSLFEAYYADIEVTRNFCLHGCKNQFSFGARYASIEHHEQLFGRTIIDDGILEAGGRSNRAAHGTGLTFGLNGRKPLFCNSCAHWFYSARTSILWGSANNSTETYASVIADPGATAVAGSIDGAIVPLDDDLFIGEIQAGIEWDFALRCLPTRAFFRVAAEYQYWDAGTGGVATGSFAGLSSSTPTDSEVFATADAPGLIVDLYGFAIATGFTW